jgi:hypothetical protein
MNPRDQKRKYKELAVIVLIAIGITVVIFSLRPEKATPLIELDLAGRKNALELLRARPGRGPGISHEAQIEILTTLRTRNRSIIPPTVPAVDILNARRLKKGAN